MLQLHATFERFGNVYIGYVDEFKGTVAQGDSLETTQAELTKLIRVKLAYDLKFPIEQIKAISDVPANFIPINTNKYRLELV